MVSAGCEVVPDYSRPVTPRATRFTEAPLPVDTGAIGAQAGADHVFSQGADIPGAWSALFRSPVLTELVATALRRNATLEATAAALRQAQETASAQKGALLPSVSAQLSRTRERVSGAKAGMVSPAALSQVYGYYDGQLNVSYTFDV